MWLNSWARSSRACASLLQEDPFPAAAASVVAAAAAAAASVVARAASAAAAAKAVLSPSSLLVSPPPDRRAISPSITGTIMRPSHPPRTIKGRDAAASRSKDVDMCSSSSSNSSNSRAFQRPSAKGKSWTTDRLLLFDSYVSLVGRF